MVVKANRFSTYYYLLITIGVSLSAIGCRSGNTAEEALKNPVIAAGQTLAQKHCATCHILPDPKLLDQETWENDVLPAMAPHLGLEVYPGNQYYAGRNAAISYEDWQKLILFYKALAPIKLKPATTPDTETDKLAIFKVEIPRRDTSHIAMTTLVAMDTLGKHLYSSDALRSDLSQWNTQWQKTQVTSLPSAAVHATFLNDKTGNEKAVFTTLGTMKAADIARGQLIEIGLKNGQLADTSVIYSNLQRPLQSVAADLNNDGLQDWVVCAFGHTKGGLYWLKQTPEKRFVKMPIREIAGAIQAVAQDFNGDGWTDLMVLFAHADEGVWLFLNDKKGGFTEKNLLRFPPVYGSTSFQLVDFNNDGQLDLLYTCGDNSDFSKILKPYHGMYIYLNQGDFRFKQAYFYPINGCTKAVAADFDLDGDLDIVTIAFFADFIENPAEGCMYFEQKNSLQFQPYALPISTYGRWICMDVNDVDADGDMDVVLGNFAKTFIIQPELKPNWDTYWPFIVLKNKTR